MGSRDVHEWLELDHVTFLEFCMRLEGEGEFISITQLTDARGLLKFDLEAIRMNTAEYIFILLLLPTNLLLLLLVVVVVIRTNHSQSFDNRIITSLL